MPQAIRIVDRIQDQADFQGTPTDGLFLVWSDSASAFVQPNSVVHGSDGSLAINYSGSGDVAINVTGGMFHMSGGKACFETNGSLIVMGSGLHGDTNYERMKLLWDSGSGNYQLAMQYGGTGSARGLTAVVKTFGVQGLDSSSNLQEWRNSNGTALARITKDGYFSNVATPTTGYANMVEGGYLISGNNQGLLAKTSGGSETTMIRVNASDVTEVYCGHMMTFNFGGSVAMKMFDSPTAGTGMLHIDNTPAGVNYPALTVRSAVSQSANLQEWQDSTGVAKAFISSGGTCTAGGFTTNAAIGNILNGGTQLQSGGVVILDAGYGTTSTVMTAKTASTVAAVVKGTTSQSADLQQWQSSDGTVLGRVGPNGGFGNSTTPLYTFHALGGGLRTQALGTPTAPTVTPTGTTGSTTYTYYVVTKDQFGNKTLQSTATTTNTGNATLTGVNYNALSWTAVTGAVSYDVIRSVGGATQGSIALAQTATTLNDTGLTASVYTPPSRDSTGDATVDGSLNIGVGSAKTQITYNNDLIFTNQNAGYGVQFTNSANGYMVYRPRTGLGLGKGDWISWNSNDNGVAGGGDIILARDAANTLAQRNGTNAQTFRVYNTYTDASNGEWFEINWVAQANTAILQPNKNGTGAARELNLQNSGNIINLSTASSHDILLTTSTFARWRVNGSSGNFYAHADNSYDIGAAVPSNNANRPRGVYAATGFGNATTPLYTFHALGGGLRTQALGTPTAPTVTPTGATGTTTYTYYVVAKDQFGNKTLQSTATSTATGNATLTGTNYNVLSWTAVTGAANYDVIRSVGGATQGSIALAQTATTLNDTGLTASAYTTPSVNATGDSVLEGLVTIRKPGGTPGTNEVQVYDDTNGGWVVDKSGNRLNLCSGGSITFGVNPGAPSNTGYAYLSGSQYRLAAGLTLGWASSDPISSGIDLALLRDAANTLAQRNGVNAQAFRVYNTYTDASNYERLGINWSGNVCTLASEAAGTGSIRPITIANLTLTGTPTAPTATTGTNTTQVATTAFVLANAGGSSISGSTTTTLTGYLFGNGSNVVQKGTEYALGSTSTATGATATAFGQSNTAAGNNSSAIGVSNSMNAASLNCHLVGGYNFGNATSFSSVAFGLLNNQTGGTLNITTGAITGTPAAATTIGRLSTAVGVNNTASGNYSTASGYKNTASGAASTASGYKNTVSGTGSTASGSYNSAVASSTAVGFSNTASGIKGTAVGYTNTASNYKATAVGANNTASGSSSSAFGQFNTASGVYSVASGAFNTAAGNNSSAIGFRNSMNAASLNNHLVGGYNFGNATSFAAVAFGLLNNQQSGTLNTTTGVITGTPAAATTIGKLSTAVGVKNTASGVTSVALGYNNTTTSISDVAVGASNTANAGVALGSSNSVSGSGVALGTANTATAGLSVAAGYNCNTSSGARAVAFGRSCTASGYRSTSAGYNGTSSGNYSSGFGYRCTSAGINSSAIGFKNSMDAASLNNHLVGGYNFGNATSFASVAFGLLNNQTGGTLNLSTGVITGTPAAATTIGRLSVAVGINNTASGYYSIAAGIKNTTSGIISSAVGLANTASGSYSVALGYTNTASNAKSVALGALCTASANNSVAIGISVSNSTATSLAIGADATNILATSANQLTFAGLQIPRILSTTTGINALSTGPTTLYTVPAGKTAVITQAIVRITAATSPTSNGSGSIGIATGNTDIFGTKSMAAQTGTSLAFIFQNSNTTFALGTATAVIAYNQQVAATATAMTLAVDLIGYLI